MAVTQNTFNIQDYYPVYLDNDINIIIQVYYSNMTIRYEYIRSRIDATVKKLKCYFFSYFFCTRI